MDFKNLCQNRVPGEFHTTAINFIWNEEAIAAAKTCDVWCMRKNNKTVVTKGSLSTLTSNNNNTKKSGFIQPTGKLGKLQIESAEIMHEILVFRERWK